MPLKLDWPCWIGVVSDDLEAQRRFFRDVLGLTEASAGQDWVQFDFGEGHMLELLQRKDDDLEADAVRYQVGYAVHDIDAARRELIARGAHTLSEVHRQSQFGGAWCYFADPEGNVFEIKEKTVRRA